MVYTLPNDNIIDDWELFDAAMDADQRYVYFLDAKTGDIKKADAERKRSIGYYRNHPERYYEIPRVPSEIKHQELQRWISEMLITTPDHDKDEQAQRRYQQVLDEQGADACLQYVYNDRGCFWNEGGVRQWMIDGESSEVVNRWLEGLPIGVRDLWPVDDDCPICQMMRKADENNRTLTPEELKHAFRKAQHRGGTIGGDLYNTSE